MNRHKYLSFPIKTNNNWGQRQVGKTTTIKNFFFKNNIDFAYVDLSKDAKIHEIIKRFDIDDLIQWSKVKYGFNKNSPYIFFDEAQHCLQIVQMLKYFRELNPELRIIVAGNLLQLKLFENKEKIMYPTGKVLLVKLNPLSFEEFIENIYPNINDQLIDCFRNKNIDSLNVVYKNKLLDSYYKYLLIGGMPKPVASYIESIKNNYPNVFKKSFNDILTLREIYLEDIKDHFGSITEKNKSEAIFTDLHLQISKENKRFIVSNINMKNRENINNRLRDFVIPIRKLMISGIIYSIKYLKELKVPFICFTEESKFKLYYSDISFYTKNYDLSYEQIDTNTNDWNIIKSGVAENFVFNELNNNYPINLPCAKDWYTYSKKNKNENIKIVFCCMNIIYNHLLLK